MEVFTGRKDDCEKIMSFVTNPTERLLLLCATRGYGKTSIVLEGTHRLLARGYNVIYVDCQNDNSVEDLASKIIENVHPQLTGCEKAEDVAVKVLQKQGEETILILLNLNAMLNTREEPYPPVRTTPSPDTPPTPSASQWRCETPSPTSTQVQLDEFIDTIAKTTSVKILATSTEHLHFIGTRFKIHAVQPLPPDDCVSLFKELQPSLTDEAAGDLAVKSEGIPLIIGVFVGLLQTESVEGLIARFDSLSRSPEDLLRQLGHEALPATKRIDHIFELCFNRLSDKNKALLITLAVFPSSFSLADALNVARSSKGHEVEGLLITLHRKCVLHMSSTSKLYSLKPFVRAFCLMKATTDVEDTNIQDVFNEAVVAFTSHYLDELVQLDRAFYSTEVKSAIDGYTREKYNIKQALTWCGKHPHFHEDKRVEFIDKAIATAVFLNKVMRKREIMELFLKLAKRCSDDEVRHSECLTNIGAKIVLSCMCPKLCDKQAKEALHYLEKANDIQKRQGVTTGSIRAQCLSKLARCRIISAGDDVEKAYELINDALAIRVKLHRETGIPKDHVMLGTCYNDHAGTVAHPSIHFRSLNKWSTSDEG